MRMCVNMREAIRESLMRMRVSHPFLIIQRLAVQSLSIFQFHEMSRASGGMYVLCMCMTLKRPCFMYYTFALSFVIVVIIINVIFIIIIIISHLFCFFELANFTLYFLIITNCIWVLNLKMIFNFLSVCAKLPSRHCRPHCRRS